MTDLVWCYCEAFDLWYVACGDTVCRCGHRDTEHLDRTRVCLGQSTRSLGEPDATAPLST